MEDPQTAKKSRSANYTGKEKELLISLAAKYKSIIENKKTDNVSVLEKNQAWRKLADEFNSIAPNLCFRSAESLKKFYENRKKGLRKKIGDFKKEMFITGGGPPPVLKKDFGDEVLLSIVSEKSLFGLPNPFDSDRGSVGEAKDVCDKEDNIEDIMLPGEDLIQEQHSEEAPEDFQVSNNNNDIEIICEKALNTRKNLSEEPACSMYGKNWSRYKASDLSQSKFQKLGASTTKSKETQEKKKETISRRRPHSMIKTMSASNLHDKYEMLVEQKLVTENFARQKSQLEIEFMQHEHELRMKSLELDIKIKEKQLLDLLK